MKFKVGDVVRVVEPFKIVEPFRNYIGTVVKIHEGTYPYDVYINLPSGKKERTKFAEEELEIAKSHIINTILNEI
jgi:hypothetical protein